MTIASRQEAKFKQTDANVGSFDAGYGSAYLAKMVGQKFAREINGKSPTAQRMLKFAFNLVDDGLMGQQVFAGEATRLAYMTDEAVEGKEAFLNKRNPNWEEFPFYY